MFCYDNVEDARSPSSVELLLDDPFFFFELYSTLSALRIQNKSKFFRVSDHNDDVGGENSAIVANRHRQATKETFSTDAYIGHNEAEAEMMDSKQLLEHRIANPSAFFQLEGMKWMIVAAAADDRPRYFPLVR